MANYPTDGYRTRGARELSMPLGRNTGNAAAEPRVATAPRHKASGDLRNVTIIPPNNVPATTTPTSGGKTIHLSPGQVQTSIDNARIRNAPNASANGLTITLTDKEYREVQRGNRKGAFRAILRALRRNPLFKDIRLRMVGDLLEVVLNIISTQLGYAPVTTGTAPFNGVWTKTGQCSTGGAPTHWAFRSTGVLGSAGANLLAAQTNNCLGNQASSLPFPYGEFYTTSAWFTYVGARLIAGTAGTTTARYRLIEAWSRPASGDTVELPRPGNQTVVMVNPFPFYFAFPTGSAAPKTGVNNRGYYPPNTPVKTKQPDLPKLPPVRVKERKLTATGAAARIWFGIGTLTEAGDLITAIWNALPNSVKYRAFVQNGKRKLNPYERAVVIFNNLDKVNLPRAILNVVENQIEDMLYGKVGKGLGLATQVMAPSRPIGLGAGGWTKGFQYTGE